MRRDFRGRTEGHEQEIVDGDLADIRSCDAVLADFGEPDEGTAMEAWYAHGVGVPVVVLAGGRSPHPWAVYVAEVSVDTVTYEARVEDFVAVQEVGRVIHPVRAAGQIEGGVAQGIGWSLYESVVWQGGRMANAQMTNYIIPTSADIPPIRVHFFENPYPGGPAGAKGIGELPMDGPAPAILNAVEHATGVRVDYVPLMPEAIMDALERETVEA